MSARSGFEQPPVRVGDEGSGDQVSPEHMRMVERHLEAEFSGRLDSAHIRRIASESLARFENAPVRTFVPILAIRAARRLARADFAAGSE